MASLSPGIRVPVYLTLHPSKINLQIFLGVYLTSNCLRKFISNNFFFIFKKLFFMQKIQLQREGE